MTLAILLSLGLRPISVEAAVSIAPTRPGNIFAADEQVVLTLESDSAKIDWQITNGFGEKSGQGSLNLQSGRGTLTPSPPGPGYYELSVTAKPGDTARAAFAVLPPRGAPAPKTRFGAMTHFAQGWDIDILPLIARAGIGSIRDEQYWDRVEKASGQFAPVPVYERYMGAATAAGLTPLIEATFANTLYDNGQTPNSDAGRAAYARYAAWLAAHDPARIGAIEVWNEYNGSFCSGPCATDRPLFYAEMLKAAYPAIKRANPQATVLGGASVLVALPYLKGVFDHGGLAAMDGVAIHPYRPVPEGVEREIAALRDLMRKSGGEKPIWATELGWGDAKTDRTEVARYLTRIVTLLLSSGVEHVYWYLARDYQSFTGMGLLRQSGDPLGLYAPTPAYVAYSALIAEIGPAAFVRREALDGRSRVYLFQDGEREIRVAWSTDGEAALDLNSASPVTVTNMFGASQPAPARHGVASVAIGRNPIFITGRVLGINEHRPDRLIADSAEDYDGAQSVNGWSYGWMDGGDSHGPPPEGVALDHPFQPLDRLGDAWAEYWGGQGLAALKIDARSVHPSSRGGHDIWTVRRWTSAIDGPVRVTLSAKLADKRSAGIGVIVLLDGKVVLARALGGSTPDTEIASALELTLHRGSILDFAVTPGASGKIDFDATSFQARLTGPPV